MDEPLSAELRKIHPKKVSRNNDTTFYRLEFKLADGRWAKTDLCEKYRNFAWWRPVIDRGIGARIGGFSMKGQQTIDADSRPRILPSEANQTSLL